MKYAAIDIGSNAIRLLIANIVPTKKGLKHKKSSLVRVPIRLGTDVFTTGIISAGQEERLINAMQAFYNLMKVHGVEKYRACATSALRESENGKEIIQRIKEKAGVQIDLISGEEEAKIIYSTHIEKLLEKNKSILYVDVGGGSTEVSLFTDKSLVASKSFKIGTVRLLEKRENPKAWDNIKNWMNKVLENTKIDYIVGSGGNINKLVKLNNNYTKKVSKEISLKDLKNQIEYLSGFSYEDRVNELGMNPDRADVILPAASIFLFIMEQKKIPSVYVPKIGLADGVVIELYDNPEFPYSTL